jgi:hypothetical protein
MNNKTAFKGAYENKRKKDENKDLKIQAAAIISHPEQPVFRGFIGGPAFHVSFNMYCIY